MNPPPARQSIRVLAVCALLFASVGAVSVAVGDGPAPQKAPAAVCDHDDYDPPALDGEWEVSFVDPLENGSLEHWSGGDLARVGGSGDCSLVVTENDAATLTATMVNGTRGVVTGSIDLGANGSLALVGANETRLATSNQGPAFSHTYRVSAGNESTDTTLSTGRFFEFALTQTENGTVQIALWDVEDDWDGEWDLRAENATGTDDLRLRLDGEVFLDGIAVSLDAESEPTDSDEGPETTPTEDEFDPSEEDDTFEYNPSDLDQTDRNQGSDGTVVFGVFLIIVGGVNVKFARGMARFSEQLDAIGSKRRWSEVEPAEWKVVLTRISGVVLLVIGSGMLLAAIFG
jgi:hypothetical protein